ncbi:MAG TPA: T9SS type A sorting domain-containing protein [Bacteroidia bacterium]
MKRKLLISALVVPFLAFSQSNKDAAKINKTTTYSKVAVESESSIASTDKPADSTVKTPAVQPNSDKKRGVISYDFVKIGSTYYDLQTNASIGRRMMLLPDGTISAVWTTSNDAAYSNRGTGYNHYDGTNWLSVANPTVRIENLRLGWPSIGLNNGKEWVMAHDAAIGGFVKSSNQSIGSTSWTVGSSILSQNQRRPIWGRVVNSGNYFHCVASYSDSSQAGDPRAPRINGVLAPMTYSRSKDGGQTWDKEHILLPGYDTSKVNDGGGDNYAIDIRDSIVAIVTGGLAENVLMWKSTDNGDNFTMYIVDTFPFAPYKSNKLIPRTNCSDGSLDVLIDKKGNAHVFWGVTSVLEDDTATAGYNFFPATSQLGYWNEYRKTSEVIAGGLQFDRDGTDSLEFSPGCWNALDANGQVPAALKNTNVFSVARLGNTSLLHAPSASLDDNGNIFVSFSMPLEQDFDDNNVNRRDIYMVHSIDTGKTWSAPQDVTQWQGSEEEFACLSKQSNGFVHMIFQRDDNAGTNLQNNSTADNNHPTGVNDIMYAAIPVSKILNNEIGLLQSVSVNDLNAAKEVFVVSQNYPNPFNSNTEVMIWLNANSNITVEITDINGKVVSTQSFGEMNAGNHILNLDSNGLSAGIYFYTVSTGAYSVTRKMSIN